VGVVEQWGRATGLALGGRSHRERLPGLSARCRSLVRKVLHASAERLDDGDYEDDDREREQQARRHHGTEEHADRVAAQLHGQQQQRHVKVNHGPTAVVGMAALKVDQVLCHRVAHHHDVRQRHGLVDNEALHQQEQGQIQPAPANAGGAGEDAPEEEQGRPEGIAQRQREQ